MVDWLRDCVGLDGERRKDKRGGDGDRESMGIYRARDALGQRQVRQAQATVDAVFGCQHQVAGVFWARYAPHPVPALTALESRKHAGASLAAQGPATYMRLAPCARHTSLTLLTHPARLQSAGCPVDAECQY
ncbi:hypothetical protein MN608_03890 [Microdochium nivale]|nr:hypothetical protein MN608_03890 [Microdochium nivale]